MAPLDASQSPDNEGQDLTDVKGLIFGEFVRHTKSILSLNQMLDTLDIANPCCC